MALLIARTLLNSSTTSVQYLNSVFSMLCWTDRETGVSDVENLNSYRFHISCRPANSRP